MRKAILFGWVFFVLICLNGCASAVRIKHITAMSPIIPKSQESKPVMLSKVVVKLPRGQVIGSVQGGLMCIPQTELYWQGGRVAWDTEELAEVLRDEFEKNGYTVVGDPNALFDDESAWKAEYLIGGLIKKLSANICYPMAGFGSYMKSKGEMYIEVEWQIKSKRTRDVVLTFETEGSSEIRKEMPLGEAEVLMRAFSVAVNNMLSDREFFELVAYDKDVPERLNKKESIEPIFIKYRRINELGILKEFPSSEMVKKTRSAAVTIYAGNGWGSGFIITDDGYILTNAHVVGNSTFVQVKLVTGSEKTGEVIRKDKERDVALVKLEEDIYPYAVIGNSATLSVSDEVFAIGTPKREEYAHTVSKGIVSNFRAEDNLRYIQSDVSVHPGNSGGPLVSENYGVVGLTVQGLMSAGGSRIGLNYFIPIEEALNILKIEQGAKK